MLSAISCTIYKYYYFPIFLCGENGIYWLENPLGPIAAPPPPTPPPGIASSNPKNGIRGQIVSRNFPDDPPEKALLVTHLFEVIDKNGLFAR
jgi:hypothetical protein